MYSILAVYSVKDGVIALEVGQGGRSRLGIVLCCCMHAALAFTPLLNNDAFECFQVSKTPLNN